MRILYASSTVATPQVSSVPVTRRKKGSEKFQRNIEFADSRKVGRDTLVDLMSFIKDKETQCVVEWTGLDLVHYCTRRLIDAPGAL